MVAYGSTTAPSGWLLCYGQTISRTTYADLFTAISTTYGSTDSATFKVPDMRGRQFLGIDNLGGVSANRVTASAADTLGGTSGSQTTTATGSVAGSISINSVTLNQTHIPASLVFTTQATETDAAETGVTHVAKGDISSAIQTATITWTNSGGGQSFTPTGSLSGAVLTGDAVTSMNPYMAVAAIIKI